MSKRKGELSTALHRKYRKVLGKRDGWNCKNCGVPLVPEGEMGNPKYFIETNDTYVLRNGYKMPQLDHIVPLSVENIRDLSNFQLLCGTCNNKKRARMP